jgi:cellobiose-specific phosphotransferase system component IIC
MSNFTTLKNLDNNLLGGFLITLGIIFSELAIEDTNPTYTTLGVGSFVTGWYMYLKDQPTSLKYYGALIPIIAMLGQMYFGYILSNDVQTRQDMIYVTLMFAVIFMMAWMYYAYNLSKTDDTFDWTKGKYVFSGLFMLMMSMMFYFTIRKNDLYELTGGIVPKMNEGVDFGAFNPSIATLTYGWTLLSIGASV